MMLALGVGGWVAGLFHLITHAFFKSLLFLCSGSVIHAATTTRHAARWAALSRRCRSPLHDARRLPRDHRRGMPFVGFSGYYSKDAILGEALGFAHSAADGTSCCSCLPLVGAGITAFYMFRLWFMTFAGQPRDHHVYDHAHESPRVMTMPLVILAVFAVCRRLGLAALGSACQTLSAKHCWSRSQPAGMSRRLRDCCQPDLAANMLAQRSMNIAGGSWPSASPLLGFLLAYLLYYRRSPRIRPMRSNSFPASTVAREQVVLRRAVQCACRAAGAGRRRLVPEFDMLAIDRFIDSLARARFGAARLDGRFDNSVIDGSVNLVGQRMYAIGELAASRPNRPPAAVRALPRRWRPWRCSCR